VEIGLICSEKQAIDATLESLAKEDPRFGKVADHYGMPVAEVTLTAAPSSFSVKETGQGKMALTCTDKFGRLVDFQQGRCLLTAAPGCRPRLPLRRIRQRIF